MTIASVQAQQFYADVRSIASSLMESLGIKHDKEVNHLSDPLIRWMDFRLRYVDPRPRHIRTSNKFPKNLPPDAASALHRFERAAIAGEDLNSFQGMGLTQHHDTSAKKRQHRTDLLWADWGLWHFHLTEKPSDDNSWYSPRADWLLFAVVLEDAIAFIDVRPHSEPGVFSNTELVETMIRSFPALAESYKLKGILGSTKSRTPAEVHQLRTNGLCDSVVVDGVSYMPPGLGLSSASTSTRAKLQASRVGEATKALAAMVENPSGQFFQHARSDTSKPYKLALTAKGIGVYDEASRACWLLPRANGSTSQSWLEELHDLILPKWMQTELVKVMARDST